MDAPSALHQLLSRTGAPGVVVDDEDDIDDIDDVVGGIAHAHYDIGVSGGADNEIALFHSQGFALHVTGRKRKRTGLRAPAGLTVDSSDDGADADEDPVIDDDDVNGGEDGADDDDDEDDDESTFDIRIEGTLDDLAASGGGGGGGGADGGVRRAGHGDEFDEFVFEYANPVRTILTAEFMANKLDLSGDHARTPHARMHGGGAASGRRSSISRGTASDQSFASMVSELVGATPSSPVAFPSPMFGPIMPSPVLSHLALEIYTEDKLSAFSLDASRVEADWNV